MEPTDAIEARLLIDPSGPMEGMEPREPSIELVLPTALLRAPGLSVTSRKGTGVPPSFV